MQSVGSQSPQQQKLLKDLDVKTKCDLALLLSKNYPPDVYVWQTIAETYGMEMKFITSSLKGEVKIQAKVSFIIWRLHIQA